MPSPERPPVKGRRGILRWITPALLLTALVKSDQVLQRQSPHENLEHDAIHTIDHTIEVTKIPNINVPFNSRQRYNTLSNPPNEKYHERYIKNDVSALAPATTAVAASSPRNTSPQTARNLEDWEVEDFVLLATIDGKLHAQDRTSGKERWVIDADNGVVNSTHYGQNYSSIEENYSPTTMDDYIWAIEPTNDGNIYIYRRNGPNGALANTGLTMKRLVEDLSPYKDLDPAVTYTGEKKTTLVVIDARSGEILRYHGSGGSMAREPTCLNTNGLSKSDTECKTSPTLTIGRTEYIVRIDGKDGHPIAQLQFSEWVPNNADNDLKRQYNTTLDNKYIYTTANGGVFCIDHNDKIQGSGGKKKYQNQLSSPVVRVFDVARPWGAEEDEDSPELIVLPQPVPPIQEEDAISVADREHSIFLNHTEDGSWFALSGKYYPTAVQGVEQAMVEQQEWLPHNVWDRMKQSQRSKALVGLHSIDHYPRDGHRLSLPAGPENESVEEHGLLPPLDGPPSMDQWALGLFLPIYLSLLDFIKNPILFVLMAGAFTVYFKRNFKHIQVAIDRYFREQKRSKLIEPLVVSPVANDAKEAEEDGKSGVPAVKVLEAEDEKLDTAEDAATPRTTRANSLEVPSTEQGQLEAEDKSGKPKRKRGNRGGVKHKRGQNRARSSSQDDMSHDPKPPQGVDEIVKHAQEQAGQQPKQEPDIQTMPQNPAEISGPVIRVGDLVVTDKLIGTGSNGTMVFEGKFDGRQVAVKRMLIQFFDIASQETKLLRESDDHANVIRYYTQQQAAGFLYIALELCPASLSDIISKPHLHPDLVQSGEKDLPSVLYQIANGLAHLHDLRIVHRDLKPQNILISKGKDGKPRLLVSDFGLCKKLEDGSFFGATTAHAAGTAGWRAPELLLDEDANMKGNPASLNDASTNGDSSSGKPSVPGMRVVSRAIDIFSLGLVFFYVLTKGDHPYNDGGGEWMREYNIRKGNANLDRLDILGDYAFEARDLIRSMLNQNPRARPTAREVMAHPFFWSTKKRLNFLCDVSDHFEKECRDPPSLALQKLEASAPHVTKGDFLKALPRDFVESLGKQRKYTGNRLLDLLRALRNKKNHYEDMSDKLKKEVGALPDGYLFFWTTKFSNLLITCWNVVYEVGWEDSDRFRDYYQPAGL